RLPIRPLLEDAERRGGAARGDAELMQGLRSRPPGLAVVTSGRLPHGPGDGPKADADRLCPGRRDRGLGLDPLDPLAQRLHSPTFGIERRAPTTCAGSTYSPPMERSGWTDRSGPESTVAGLSGARPGLSGAFPH